MRDDQEDQQDEHSDDEISDNGQEASHHDTASGGSQELRSGDEETQTPQSELWKSLSALREKLERGEINPTAWMWHFSSYPAYKIPVCEDCADFDTCEYGHDMPPIECFSKPERHKEDKWGLDFKGDE